VTSGAALARALASRGASPLPSIEWVAEIGSTNDRAKALARAGAVEWTTVVADRQTGGRGRSGREWVSPPGGLYASVVLRPRFRGVSVLPLAAGVATAEAVAEWGARPRLKWPNDVLLDGRKLAGILAEAASGPAGFEWAVLGIGVNVSLDPALVPAAPGEGPTSLDRVVSPAPPVPELAAAVLARLRVWYDELETSPARVVDAWRSRAVDWWGRDVEVSVGAETVRGRALDVDSQGALVIERADGTRRAVLSGEVTRARAARGR
jgi:BirA family biotin operon repressor/biotin-[acetyl-CoA-carboxylase] ligase